MATNTYVALQTQTLGSAAANVTFNSIPATYTDLVLVITGASSAGDQVGLQYNGDTANNYSSTWLQGNGSIAQSSRLSNIPFAASGYFRTGFTNQVVFQIQNYSNTTTYKTCLARMAETQDGTWANVSMWRSTAAINSIKCYLYSGSNYAAGTTFSLYGIAASGVSPAAKATGGVIYSDSTYYYHVFPASGTFTALQSLTVDSLVIAGGGGGGGTGWNVSNGDTYGAAGGGAGGLLVNTSQSLTSGAYTITIGAGGAGGVGGGPNTSSGQGTSGSNSLFGGLVTATGGGGGGYDTGPHGSNGLSGGSGGGGAPAYLAGTWGMGGSASPSGQGYAGGNAGTQGGGGGGGSGSVGSNGTTNGGDGGSGTLLSVWSSATGTGKSGYYAGGGGGSKYVPGATSGSGGSGGGGAGAATVSSNGNSGSTNTGGGGGGAGGTNGVTVSGPWSGGNGGSGLVIIRYAK